MEEKERNFYDKIKDAVSAYLLHDPNAQAVTAFERERKKKAVDDKTLEMFRESAEAGHPFSCFNRGRCYETGNGVEKDLEKAYDWYRKAAVGGDANAWLALAKMFDKGLYVKRDPKEAAMWLSRAADKGHPIAKIGMGQKYARGDGVDRDPARAFEYFKEAQKLEPGIGSYILGEAIGDGIGCEKNYEEAFRLFQIAHDNKFPLGTYNIGMMYEMGLGVEKDEKKGFEYLTQAADEGIAEAMYRLAFHYREGTSEATKDPKIAFDYFKKASDKGFPPAMVETGICYENGYGVERNKATAFRCYQKAAATGLHTAIVCLAVCYRAGIGCEVNEEKAIELVEQAARLGNSRAYHLLAQYLMEENPYDERAINLEMIAAESGFIRSALFLGGFFVQNSDAGPDKERAAHYFRIAAQEGDNEANFELAEILNTEENKDKKDIQQEIWETYQGCADQGHPLAAYKMAQALREPEKYFPEEEDLPERFTDEPEDRETQAIRYMSIAASGGIPAACQEVADRSFWGDGLRVNLQTACGLYHYIADELSNQRFLARYAFCRVLTSMEFVYGKVGEYDPSIEEVLENERIRVVKEDRYWKEGMDLLEKLAKEKVPDAMIFLPLARALSTGGRVVFSSEADREMLDFIDKLPETREKYYVQGLLQAIQKPEEIAETIRILRYARSELSACNVDQILGNLYYSLTKAPAKKRKDTKILQDFYEGWASPLKTDSLEKMRDMARNIRSGSVWSDGSYWNEKKRPTRMELLKTASALYMEAYETGQSGDLRSYARCGEEISDLKIIFVIPGIVAIAALVSLLVTGFRAGWKLEANKGITMDHSFGWLAHLYLETFCWGLLASLVVIVALYAFFEYKKIQTRKKLNKTSKK